MEGKVTRVGASEASSEQVLRRRITEAKPSPFETLTSITYQLSQDLERKGHKIEGKEQMIVSNSQG